MNTSREQAKQLAGMIANSAQVDSQAELLVCPPSIHLAEVSRLISNGLALGAQDAHWQDGGAFTGEISVTSLSDYKVSYLLVGHSERREMFGDTNERVANKFEAALKQGITPILCIGESLEEREKGVTLDVLKSQCVAVIEQVGIQAFDKACIAYEPIWAIGTGKTATPEQAQDTHSALRAFLAELDSDIAEGLRILYGGSMNATNAESLLAQPDIDGGLIGGASLKAEEFMKIYNIAG
jgi:triosephosphate isomerase